MTTTPDAGHHRRNPSPPTTVEALRQEISQTRAELGETVQALTAKADVKARLQESAEDAKNRVRERVHVAVKRAEAALPEGARQAAERAARTASQYRTQLLIVAGVGILAVVIFRWQRRRTW